MKQPGKTLKPYLLPLLFLLIACVRQPESTENLTIKTLIYPVLKNKKDNPVMRIVFDNKKGYKRATSIVLELGKTAPENMSSIAIYYTGNDTVFYADKVFGKREEIGKRVEINGNLDLKEDLNVFWITLNLSEKTSLTSLVQVNLSYIGVDNKKLAPANPLPTQIWRAGLAIRDHGVEGVHTYRIPGLTTTNDGTLLAIYDVRRNSGRDLQGDIDIGVSRSVDGGETWEPMRIALDMGEWGGLPQKFNGVSDANILIDRNSNSIFIAGLWMHGVLDKNGKWIEGLTEESKAWNHQWRNKGSQPGFDVKQTSQFLITKSTDDGKTWSKPVNITKMCKKPEWWLYAPAPGHGITLSDGTIVFPTQGRDKNGLPFSNITYSKDGGKTWITSNPASHNTTESMAVELTDGSIMLNMRDNRNRKEKGGKNGRAVFVTSSLGNIWNEHPSSHGALIEPVCMASIHRHNYTGKDGNKKSVLFFSNPNDKYNRIKQTIKVSFDDGKTWPEKYWMELDEGRGAGYSCITTIDENTIGILYEGSRAQMTFQKIDVSDLLMN